MRLDVIDLTNIKFLIYVHSFPDQSSVSGVLPFSPEYPSKGCHFRGYKIQDNILTFGQNAHLLECLLQQLLCTLLLEVTQVLRHKAGLVFGRPSSFSLDGDLWICGAVGLHCTHLLYHFLSLAWQEKGTLNISCLRRWADSIYTSAERKNENHKSNR